MKLFLLLAPLVVVGCRTAATMPSKPAPSPAAAPQPTWAVQAAVPMVTPPSSNSEARIRQQTQIIEALVSQNDALAAKLDAKPEVPMTTAPVSIMAPVVPLAPPPASTAIASPPPPATKAKPDEPVLTPNFDGLIDLSIRPATESDEPVNPFVIRSGSADSTREISLHVGGIIAGPVACAVINDRLVQAGDTIETLVIERIDQNAVFIRHEGRRLRLPVSTKPVRVRLSL